MILDLGAFFTHCNFDDFIDVHNLIVIKIVKTLNILGLNLFNGSNSILKI